MPASDPTFILLTHDAWATRNILVACQALTSEQFHRRFEMGPGSLHDTLQHMIAAQRAWCDTLAQRENRPRLETEGIQRRVADLSALYDEASEEFKSLATSHPLEEMVTRERAGKTYHFSRGAILVHVTTHAMHHRAQCLNMLRHVGVNPLPPSSVVEWARTQGNAER
jgi:uncharacterized damage-inducible protein DinB